jgi:hypothetical protein
VSLQGITASRNIKFRRRVNSYAYAHAVRIGKTGKRHEITLRQDIKKKSGVKEVWSRKERSKMAKKKKGQEL